MLGCCRAVGRHPPSSRRSVACRPHPTTRGPREMIRRPAHHIAWTIVVLAAGLTLTTTAASARHAPGPCDFHRDDDQTVRQHSREQIRCAVARWPVPGGADVALCIAKRESGLLPWAESGDGLNKGLFQQHVHYWDGNYDALHAAMGGSCPAHPERPHEHDRVDPHGAATSAGAPGAAATAADARRSASPGRGARLDSRHGDHRRGPARSRRRAATSPTGRSRTASRSSASAGRPPRPRAAATPRRSSTTRAS